MTKKSRKKHRKRRAAKAEPKRYGAAEASTGLLYVSLFVGVVLAALWPIRGFLMLNDVAFRIPAYLGVVAFIPAAVKEALR